MISSGQIRAARAYIGISAAELASLAGVARMTIVKAEAEDASGIPSLNVRNLKSIQSALEHVGAVFEPNGGVNYKPGSEDPS